MVGPLLSNFLCYIIFMDNVKEKKRCPIGHQDTWWMQSLNVSCKKESKPAALPREKPFLVMIYALLEKVYRYQPSFST